MKVTKDIAFHTVREEKEIAQTWLFECFTKKYLKFVIVAK
jgi:hypothetical protein